MPDSAGVDQGELLKRLRESEELYARAFMTNPVSMSITDATSERFTHVNAAFCTLVGFPRSEVIGRTSEQLRLWPKRERREGIVERLAGDDAMPLLRATVRTKAGVDVPILVSFRVIQAGEGQSVLSVIVPLPA